MKTVPEAVHEAAFADVDEDIRQELRRGAAISAPLPQRHRALLNRTYTSRGVSHDHIGSLGRLAAMRLRRRFRDLQRRGCVQDSGTRWIITVAGIGAIRPHLHLVGPPDAHDFRARRRAELNRMSQRDGGASRWRTSPLGALALVPRPGVSRRRASRSRGGRGA